MAGHSKWANIKHRKARQDAVKGRAWSKCSRAIMAAARNGPDPNFNVALRFAIDEAKAANMPKDTIEKAIKKGAGAAEGENYSPVRYEGYGTGGVAILVDCLTDNPNRTAPEMRKLFERGGGGLAKPGSVAFSFTPRGVLLIQAGLITEEKLMDIALEAGAQDINASDGGWEVLCEPADFLTVKEALVKAGITPDSAEVTMLPSTTITCDAELGAKVLRLLDAFEEHDDVQKVYSNADIPDDVLSQAR